MKYASVRQTGAFWFIQTQRRNRGFIPKRNFAGWHVKALPLGGTSGFRK